MTALQQDHTDIIDLPADVDVAIVGSGFSGLAMARQLKRSYNDDFVVLERGDDVGGTWRDNTYPGCTCDVPSHLYSFSFALNPEWSNTFSPQPEIQAYIRRTAERARPAAAHPLQHRGAVGRVGRRCPALAGRDHARRAHRARADRRRGPAQRAAHPGRARHRELQGQGVPLRAVGPRARPARRARGGGRNGCELDPARAAHTARRGEAAPVPAHGAVDHTAAGPPPHPLREAALQARARSAAADAPRHLLGPRALRHPDAARPPLEDREGDRAAGSSSSQVPDPELRAKLTPDYAPGCKRILVANDYYPSLSEPNVEVLTGGVSEIREHSIVNADGTEREVDTIIFGTGFHVTDMPVGQHVRGRGRPHARTRSGRAARRCTAALPWPATRTSSSCWAPTPAWATPRWC